MDKLRPLHDFQALKYINSQPNLDRNNVRIVCIEYKVIKIFDIDFNF